MNKNREINGYLNRNTNIENVAVLNQIAVLFNLEKKFCSFFQSDFNDLVKHRKFLELNVVLVKKILDKPNFTSCIVDCEGHSIYYIKKAVRYVFMKRKKALTEATIAWMNHNIGERKRYEFVLLEKISQYFEAKKKYSN